jgi:hypothetical protein
LEILRKAALIRATLSRGSLETIMNRRVALFAAFFVLARMTGAFAADGASIRPLDPARDTSHLLADAFFALFLRLIGLTGPEATTTTNANA